MIWTVTLEYVGGATEQHTCIENPTLVYEKLLQLPVTENTTLYINVDTLLSIEVTES